MLLNRISNEHSKRRPCRAPKEQNFGQLEKNAASNEPPQREAKILEFQCSSAHQDEKKRGLHSAMQKFHANQTSSKKKFAAPKIQTQLATLIPPLTSQLGWFTFSYRKQPQPYLLGA